MRKSECHLHPLACGVKAEYFECYDDMPEYSLTGGPPLTRKSLTRFPLTRFLAYVRVSEGISVSRGPQYSPTNTSFM